MIYVQIFTAWGPLEILHSSNIFYASRHDVLFISHTVYSIINIISYKRNNDYIELNLFVIKLTLA